MESKDQHTPDRFERLVRRFGVGERGAEIRGCFEFVCGESPWSGASRSSLNADGTPVQFALSLAAGRAAAFEFVGEALVGNASLDYARGPHMEHEARRALGLERMARLAEAIEARRELSAVLPRLEALSDGHPGDCEDPAGAFWIGASFEPAGDASMTVYANARRGEAEGRWKRLAEFARETREEDWPPIFAAARSGGMKPLGAGLRVSAGRRPHVRVYFGAYGVTPKEYRQIFRDAGADANFDSALEMFFEEALGGERVYPTGSAVFSFGSDGGGWAPKLELCAHCAWKTDGKAEARCGAWLERLGIDTDLYRDAVGILTGNGGQSGASMVHAYVGVGMRRGKGYASVYLNPGPEL